MGTTVAGLLFQEDVVYVGQVGDSRAYLMNTEGIGKSPKITRC